MTATKRDETLRVKALYPVAELAECIGVSHQTLRRMLVVAKVDMQRTGEGKRVHALIPLAELETKMPTLWRSIVAAESIRAGVQGAKTDLIDDDD